MKELEKVAGIPHLVRIKLSQLPKTLHGMYEYALDQIPKEARDVVHRLLMWLLFAPAHLQEAEFAELVAFEFLSINAIPIYDPMLRASSPGDASHTCSSAMPPAARSGAADTPTRTLVSLFSGCSQLQRDPQLKVLL